MSGLRRLVLAAVLLAALPLAQPVRAAEERVLNIYNWSDYIDPKVLEAFTRETGIKVVYDTYDNNEILETKLLAGRSGYDIVVPSGPYLQRLIRAGAFLPLDKSKLKNLGNLWPEIDEPAGGLRSRQRLRRRLHVGHHRASATTSPPCASAWAPTRPLNSWNLVLNPASANKLKDCGIMMLDSPEDLIPSMLPAFGAKADSKRWDDMTLVDRRPLQGARQRAEVPLVGIHPGARQRRYLRGGRLFGRRAAGQAPGRRGQERRPRSPTWCRRKAR